MRIMLGRTGWRAALLASTALLAAPDVGAQTQWTGATSTDWFLAGNWTAGVPGALAVLDSIAPRPTVIGLPGATVTSRLDVGLSATGQLTVQNGGTLATGSATIGTLAGSTGTVTVTGAGSTWTNPGSLFVGDFGTGTLRIEDGGRVTTTQSPFIGLTAGSNGTVIVSGAGSSLASNDHLIVGHSGAGTLRIENGGTVSNTIGWMGKAGGSGSVVVTGKGSTWTSSSNLLIGGSSSLGTSGNGSLTIAAGGVVSSNGSAIGSTNGATGTVTVIGAGSTWTTGALRVGDPGTGTLTITDGGRVISDFDSIFVANGKNAIGTVTVSGAGSILDARSVPLRVGTSGKGTLTISDGGEVRNTVGTIADQATSVSRATVSGTGSTWTNTDNLSIGFFGSGTLRIEGGGKVSNALGIVASETAGLTSAVTVTGPGSTWTNSSLIVGGIGNGTLAVSDGGTVSAATFSIIGNRESSVSTATVTGPGSTWTNTGDFVVGNFGDGTLRIEGGGKVSNTGAGLIGRQADSKGAAVVAGSGSTWTNSDNLSIGFFGSGTLRIENGGKVSNALGIVASETAGLASAVTVTGPGSTWTNSSLIVGGIGDGTLVVSDGGTVTATTFSIIGNRESSVSTATVTGAGSTWTNTGDIVVGNFGDGTLRIEGGGTVTNTGAGRIGLRAASKGAVVVAGAGSTWTNSDILSVGFSGSGTLRIENGGKVSSGLAIVASQTAGLTSAVTVTGPGSTWTNAGDFVVGDAGDGTLAVSDGGTVTTATFSIIGNGETSVSTATVAGAGSTWTNTGDIVVGDAGDGTLRIESGGTVANSSTGFIGLRAASKGAVVVAGSGSTWTSDFLVVGENGTGALTVSDGGTVQANNAVRVAVAASARGLVNIGAAEGKSAGAPGALEAASLTFGAGSGALVLNHTGTNYAFATPITGNGAIRQLAGVTALTADSVTFSGTTAVVGGTLHVDGTLGGSVSVGVAGTLGGIGTVTGSVTVDGILAAGKSPGTLTVGTLTLNARATARFELNASGVVGGSNPVSGNDLVVVTGDLTLGGRLDARTAAGGYYRLFNYGGTLAGSFTGTDVTGTGGFTVASHQLQTGIPGQVNLSVLGTGQTLQFWDGADTTGNDVVDGGAGTWSTAGTNWTGQPGEAAVNGAWGGSVGVFGGAVGGAVAVAGTQAFDTLQFSTNGYALGGGTLVLSPASGTTGTITVDTGIATSIATPIVDGSGNGLLKVGGGTLTLSRTNLYSGDTVIGGGTLALGAGGSIATSRAVRLDAAGAALDITAGGNQLVQNLAGVAGTTVALGANTLTVASSSDTTFAGTIDGSGGLIKAGGSTLTLSGANTYTGGTVINAGTLQLGDGGTAGSITGPITNNAALTINRAGNLALDSAISGAGTLRHIGAGTTVLSATSTYSGGTSVENGRLVVNGSIANSTVTLAGGTLGGNGTVGGLIVNSGSTVAPGNSIGTLNVAGNISFAAGSTYAVEIEPAGTSDRLHATGTATLTGASVSVVKATGTYTAGTRYTILSADAGLSGTFAGFTQNLPFIDLALAYDPNTVFLDVTRNTVTFCGVAATRNQCATAAGAESLAAGNPLFDAIASLPDVASAQQAFNALSGEIHASTRTALIEDSHHLRDAVITRTRLAGITAAAPQFAALAQATDQSQRPQDGTAITAWMQGFGALARTSGNGNAASLKRSTGGVVVGADARLDDTWTIGIAAGYSRTNLDVNGRSSRADVDSYHLALYGGAQFGPLGFRLGASHTWHSVDSTRRIAFPGLTDSARADYKARTTQVFGDVGYALALGSVALEPFANLAWVHVSTNRFAEKGGIAALQGRGGSDSALFSTLGIRAAAQVWNDSDKSLTLRGSLGWRHAFGDVTPAARLAFAGGTSFGIEGVPIARDAAVVEAGFDFKIGKALTIGAGYAGVIASGARDHTFKGTLTFRF